MEKRRKISFSGYFAIYLLSIFIAIFLVGILAYMLILNTPKVLGVLPANQTELEIREAYDMLESVDPFSADLLPKHTRYILLDENNVSLEGTITKEEITEIENNSFIGISGSYFIKIPRGHETLIVSYEMKSRFQNDAIDRIITPTAMFIIVIALLLILSLLAITVLFSSKLKKQLQPLKIITEHIAKQDISFTESTTKIKEFSEIQDSLYSMRDSLQEALEKQWAQEQLGKDQILALAHDIKTPLTVVQGNADLLEDEILTEENKVYFTYLQSGIWQIERYLETLKDLAVDNLSEELKLEQTALDILSQVIIELSQTYCDTKGVRLITNLSPSSTSVLIDQQKIERCMMNIVSNAVNQSPKDGTVYLTILESGDIIQFIVEDEGCGFSEKDLRNAKDKFYIGESSRTNKENFGFGLYTANNIVISHGGSLLLENSTLHQGGKVTIVLPKKQWSC